ncbi:hypothetical protein OROHE_021631 [Orobanche hederae]
MDWHIADDSPMNSLPIRADDNSYEESEVENLRASKLASIRFHKHIHKCKKALGMTSSETPQSFVEETQFGVVGDGMEAGGEKSMVEDGAEEDDFSELDPRVVVMMWVLLPRYFEFGGNDKLMWVFAEMMN